MDLISFRLPFTLRRRLAEEAARRRVSQSTVIRETLEMALMVRSAARGELTCADLAADLVGSINGPRDLSTNKRYLDEAVPAGTQRGKKRRLRAR